MKPREIIDQIETNPALPAVTGDRFVASVPLRIRFDITQISRIRTPRVAGGLKVDDRKELS